MPIRGELDLKMRVAQCEPHPIGVRVPAPVDHALDLLVDDLAEAGIPTSRAELICALVAEASARPGVARRAVTQYRKLRVTDLPGMEPGSDPVRLIKKARGRPSTRAGRSTRWQNTDSKGDGSE